MAPYWEPSSLMATLTDGNNRFVSGNSTTMPHGIDPLCARCDTDMHSVDFAEQLRFWEYADRTS